MWSNYFILDTWIEQLKYILSSLTFKNKEVFNDKLFFLSPSNSQPLLIDWMVIFLAILLKTCGIKQIINSLIINLQERTEYVNVFTLLFLYSSNLFK